MEIKEYNDIIYAESIYVFYLLGQQGDQTSQSKEKSTLNTHWKD